MDTLFSFFKSMWALGRNKWVLLPPFLIDARYNVCHDCIMRRRGWFRNYCGLCGCTVSRSRHIFNKCADPCQECPILKWSKVQGYNCLDKTE